MGSLKEFLTIWVLGAVALVLCTAGTPPDALVVLIAVWTFAVVTLTQWPWLIVWIGGFKMLCEIGRHDWDWKNPVGAGIFASKHRCKRCEHVEWHG